MASKHLLLASVHNTATGGHKNARAMESELSQLVMRRPPEDLRRDCATWVQRCKLCTAVQSVPGQGPGYQAVSE